MKIEDPHSLHLTFGIYNEIIGENIKKKILSCTTYTLVKFEFDFKKFIGRILRSSCRTPFCNPNLYVFVCLYSIANKISDVRTSCKIENIINMCVSSNLKLASWCHMFGLIATNYKKQLMR